VAGLARETLRMILSTLRKYANDNLTPEYLLELDAGGEFPHEVLKELYDPTRLGLPRRSRGKHLRCLSGSRGLGIH